MSEILKNSFAPQNKETSAEKTPSKEEEYSYPHLGTNDTHLEKLIARLRQTELGKQLVDDAEAYGTKISSASLNGAHGAFDDEKNEVYINSCANEHRQVATLAHELRHAQQFKNGVQLNALTDKPKDYLHSQWTIEADANVAACMVAWELQEQGQDDVMKAFSQENAHITKPFLKEAENGGVETNKAQQAAFNGWFDDMFIRNAYEKNYIRNFENRKKRASRDDLETALTRDVPVSENVDKICKTQKGTYLTGKEAETFFSKPEMTSVNNDTYWAIYRNVRDARRLGFFSEASEVMKDEGNFTIRTSGFYEISKKSLETRQEQASEKIKTYKETKKAPVAQVILSKSTHSR